MEYISLNEARFINLSKNFMLDEFIKSETALKFGINNDMPIHYVDRLKFLATTVLQPIRDKFGPIRVTSGWRTPELAPYANSNTRSNHSSAFAADIEPLNKDVKLSDIALYISRELQFKELIAEYLPVGWIHVAAENGNNIKQRKIKEYNKDYILKDKNSFEEYLRS